MISHHRGDVRVVLTPKANFSALYMCFRTLPAGIPCRDPVAQTLAGLPGYRFDAPPPLLLAGEGVRCRNLGEKKDDGDVALCTGGDSRRLARGVGASAGGTTSLAEASFGRDADRLAWGKPGERSRAGSTGLGGSSGGRTGERGAAAISWRSITDCSSCRFGGSCAPCGPQRLSVSGRCHP